MVFVSFRFVSFRFVYPFCFFNGLNASNRVQGADFKGRWIFRNPPHGFIGHDGNPSSELSLWNMREE